jgi:tRNA-Thr(GGU) m(6)t(6)A37 methyltransferase TsaA
VDITFHPIGTVRNDYPAGQRPPTWQGTASRIEIDPRWTEALSGLDGFSHLLVLCYLHLSSQGEPSALIHPQGNPGMPLVGFFGTRTPHRPNPIALTMVLLVERRENVLHVRNLDMYDGTPVLDVKPYLPHPYPPSEIAYPPWVHRLRTR